MRATEIRDRFVAVLAEHRPQHLVHVGGHLGEEIPGYLTAGIPTVTVIEPIPHLAQHIRDTYPTVAVVECACSDQPGTATLHIPAKTNMATLVPSDGETITVATRRLDDITPVADAAVIDVQGHEFPVLAAAPWETLRLVMVETCTITDPALSPRYDDTVRYMAARGFAEVDRMVRDYDWIQRWAYGRTTSTGAEVRDVVFAKAGG